MSGKHWQKAERAVNWVRSTRSLVIQAYLSVFCSYLSPHHHSMELHSTYLNIRVFWGVTNYNLAFDN